MQQVPHTHDAKHAHRAHAKYRLYLGTTQVSKQVQVPAYLIPTQVGKQQSTSNIGKKCGVYLLTYSSRAERHRGTKKSLCSVSARKQYVVCTVVGTYILRYSGTYRQQRAASSSRYLPILRYLRNRGRCVFTCVVTVFERRIQPLLSPSVSLLHPLAIDFDFVV